MRPPGVNLLFRRIALGGVHRSLLWCGLVGRRWHKGFGLGVHESTDIHPPEKTPCSGPGAIAGAARSSSCARLCMITCRTPIMGNGRGKKPLFAGLESPAIVHNELAARARFVAFDVLKRDFPGNRSPPRWKFVSRPKRKICAPREGVSSQRRPRHSPLRKRVNEAQLRSRVEA